MSNSLIWGLIFAFLMLAGISCIGGLIVATLLRVGSPPCHLYGQNIALGIGALTIVVSWGSLVYESSRFYSATAFTLMVMGVGWLLYLAYFKVLRSSFFVGALKKNPFHLFCPNVFIILLLGLYCIANIGLVTNADSLDYHIGYAANYLKEPFYSYPEWFTGRLAQTGEKIIALGLSWNSQSFAALVQYAGLTCIVRLLLNFKSFSLKIENNNIVVLAFLSTPVLLFLCISAKPQMMPLAMSTLAFALLICANDFPIKEKKIHLIWLLLPMSLAMLASTQKSSFLVSSIFISLLSCRIAIRSKLLTPFIFFSALLAVFIFTPVYLDKYLRYETGILSFLLSPPGGIDDSLKAFMIWVSQYRENPLPFPLYIFIPSGPGTLTTVLGAGGLLFIFGLYRSYSKSKFYVNILCIFALLLWFIGQPSTRFYFEVYVWGLIIILHSSIQFSERETKIFRLLINLQASLIALVLVIYCGNVLMSFQGNSYISFMKKYSDAYELAGWIESNVPHKEPILYDHRSRALLNNPIFSTDPIEFGGADDIQLKDLEKNLIKSKVTFLATRSDSVIFTTLYDCSDSIFLGPVEFIHKSRNPFNAGVPYSAYIMKIEPSTFFPCVRSKGKGAGG